MTAVSTVSTALEHHASADPEQIEAIVKVFAEVLKESHGGLLKREATQLLANPAELRRKLMEFKRFNLQGIYEGL